MTIRWQDWTSVLVGTWLVLSPWLLGFWLDRSATENACGTGMVLIFFNIISACRLLDEGQEFLNILIGVWLLLSPYALGFAALQDAVINVSVAGTLVVALAVWQLHDAAKGGHA